MSAIALRYCGGNAFSTIPICITAAIHGRIGRYKASSAALRKLIVRLNKLDARFEAKISSRDTSFNLA